MTTPLRCWVVTTPEKSVEMWNHLWEVLCYDHSYLTPLHLWVVRTGVCCIIYRSHILPFKVLFGPFSALFGPFRHFSVLFGTFRRKGLPWMMDTHLFHSNNPVIVECVFGLVYCGKLQRHQSKILSRNEYFDFWVKHDYNKICWYPNIIILSFTFSCSAQSCAEMVHLSPKLSKMICLLRL